MDGCLAAEVGADQKSNKRRVAPSHRDGLSSRQAGKFNPISSSSLTKGFHRSKWSFSFPFSQFFWYKEESIIILFPKQENGNSS
ncbi:hypothetical protein V6N12_071130 [Hibiscus sabdariffa]|uniref:Uncharacterized protein n=1 Tax=Hibiscus sabdariffa TaxID=183260 RepID=A0ABR2FIV4_9ROSI